MKKGQNRFFVGMVIFSLLGLVLSPLKVLAATTIGANIDTDGNLTADGSLQFTSGAVADYILKTDASGNATWISVGVALGNSDTDSLPEGAINLYYDQADVDSRADARIALQAGAVGGLATLDGSGLVPSAQLPAIAITNVYVAANIAARNALTVETGDVAIVLDAGGGAGDSRTYIYDGAVWQELLDPTNLYLTIANNLSDLSNPAAARTNLGLAINSDVQAWDAGLDDIAGLAVTDNNFIVGDGANWVAESANTARTSLGLGTGDSPTLTGLTVTGGSLQTGNAATTGSLLIFDGSANKITLTAPALGADYTLTLPTTDGNASEFLQTDGSGNLTWVTAITAETDPNALLIANDLSDLSNVATAQNNLNLGTGDNPTFAGLTLGLNGSSGSLTIFSEQGGTDYQVVLQPNAAMTQNTTYILPADDGSASQVLSTDGSGILSWAAPGGGVGADSLDFTEFSDAMSVDASTTINLGANNLSLTSAGAGVLTLTSGAAATWGTGAGNLSLQAAGSGATANVQIGAGGAGSATPDYFALDVKSTTGDPAGGAEGYMYYNTFDNKFRCFENAAWTDCIPNGALGDITAVGDILTGAAFTQTAGSDGTSLWFEGATGDANEIKLTSADPGADFTITLPAATGEVSLLGQTIESSEVTDNTITVSDLNATLTYADADFIDLSAINMSSTTEGLKLGQAADCSAATAEGQICWETDADTLWMGNGVAAVSIGNPFGAAIDSAEITDNTITATDLNATLTFADADFIDLSAINMSSTTEGLKLGQAADCSAATAEGQICWDTDDDALYMGTGAAAIVSANRNDTATFTDTSPAAFADNNTTELFNDSPVPNITTDSATSTVLISFTVRGTSADGDDETNAVFLARDATGADPTCGTDPQVGEIVSGFTTTTGSTWSASGTFLDSPGTAGQIRYQVCTSSATSTSLDQDTVANAVVVTLVESGP